MENNDISRLPVVEKLAEGKLKLLGWLTNHDITHSFITAKKINELEKAEEFLINV